MKILVAVDQSNYAGKVLDKAIELANRDKAEIEVLTAIESFAGDLDILGSFPDAMEKLREAAAKAVDAAKAKITSRGLTASGVVVEGDSAASAIVSRAEKTGADLIVIGHKGKSALERFLVGSVTASVVAHAPCSVHVVR